MILVWIMLVVGFVLLIKGADYFVEGSSAVAKILRIPSVVIGLTIVAMGTSAPELAVSVTAALTGNNEIAVGNVIGSNIFNLMVVTGTCGVILPMAVDKGILNGDFIFSIIISGVLLAMFAFDMQIGRLDGIILLVLFAYFIVKLVRKALKERTEAQEEAESLSPIKIFIYIVGGIAAIVMGGDIVVDRRKALKERTEAQEEAESLSPIKIFIYIVGGIAAIVMGGDIVVDSASKVASSFGLSQNLIGLTIVAMGTSLPELVTSIVASRKGENGLALGNVIGSASSFGLSQNLIGLTIVAMGTSLPELVTSIVASRKGENGLALGNVIGSNIFNILMILGISSAIHPIAVTIQSSYDLIVLIVFSAAVWLMARSRKEVNRGEGIAMLALYFGYMVYIIMR